MGDGIKRSLINILLDVVKVYIKTKTGAYNKNPLGIVVDAKDAIDDAKDLHTDIKTAIKNDKTDSTPDIDSEDKIPK